MTSLAHCQHLPPGISETVAQPNSETWSSEEYTTTPVARQFPTRYQHTVPYRQNYWLNLRTVHPQQTQIHARKRKQRVYSSLPRISRLERNWDIDGSMMGWNGQGRGEEGGSALHEWTRADLTSNATNEQILQIKHHRSSIYFREGPISKLPSTPQEKIVVHDDLHSKASPHHWPYAYALSNERRSYASERARRVYMWVKSAK